MLCLARYSEYAGFRADEERAVDADWKGRGCRQMRKGVFGFCLCSSFPRSENQPPYPPLTGGQEKAKPPPPGRRKNPTGKRAKVKPLYSSGWRRLFIPPCQGGVGGVAFTLPKGVFNSSDTGGFVGRRGRNCRPMKERLLRLMKTARRVDEIAQHRLSDFHLAREEAFDSLFQKLLAKRRVTLDPRPNRFPEIPRERHGWYSFIGGASAR